MDVNLLRLHVKMLLEAIVVCVLIILITTAYFHKSCWYCQLQYYYIGLVYHLHDIFNIKNNKINLVSMPDKIAIVTGGSRGIGVEVVKKLLQCDMEVIVAAIMFPSVYQKTEDGYEEQWAINYLSHFLLTSLLLPLLKNGGHPNDCSRIINVTSCAHDVGKIDFDYISNNSKKTFCTYSSYGQSKLAQTMSTITMQRLFANMSLNVLVYSVHPGIVKTDLFKETILGNKKWAMAAWKTSDQGATSIIYAAINKDIEKKGGIFISNCIELTVPLLAHDERVQKRLFELSLEQVQLKDFFQYL
ncbi:dehydrogenase/reductase SDR family member on chromosome X-like isoform X2 [Pogonomyrmex barbatus]|uniref:Dehydrogenase/reductase SDR family member on chromosome X-like isoform X2 n=1 Tax=Pogonomyrmex barbatus TaxID=144034 RepID=A0A6I9XLS3_9HYME|nr:dehydrogenase/reductase SDR family member on chromosome X-like isoform X2 [Pogonomyrmex barbatus]